MTKFKITINGLVEADDEEEALRLTRNAALLAENTRGPISNTFDVVSVEELKEEAK